MNLDIVPLSDVDLIWPRVGPDLVKCLAQTPSYLSAGELWQMCRSGQAFLFVGHEDGDIYVSAVWRFERGFGTDVLNCLVLAGSQSDKWASSIIEKAADLAREGGATAITATGRLGLIQMLKKNIPDLKIVRQTYFMGV